MFRRRDKPEFRLRLSNLLWPHMGWRRTFAYWIHRVGRLPGSNYAISAGIAFGAAISFTPFVGLHLVIAGLLAWIFRANILASAIGTLVGNPWTFPFIWIWIYQLGVWSGIKGISDELGQQHFSDLFGRILTALLKLDVSYLLQIAWPIFYPMLAGAIPTGFITWIGFYFLSKLVIEAVHNNKIRKP